jgi:hypothetical protein
MSRFLFHLFMLSDLFIRIILVLLLWGGILRGVWSNFNSSSSPEPQKTSYKCPSTGCDFRIPAGGEGA